MKNLKKGLSLLLSLMLVLGAVSAGLMSVSADDEMQPVGDGIVWNNAEQRYEISSYAGLKAFASIVNGTHDTIPENMEASAVLTDNIICKNNSSDTEYASDWIPIADSSTYFGTFDGDGHVITGLTTPEDYSGNFSGLFGSVSAGGTVRNVGLEGGSLTSKNDKCAGVVAYNFGGTVRNCYNTGSISGNSYTGGVVGENYGGTVENCYNTGSVTGSDSFVGGVVGLNEGGTVENCYNTGSVKNNSTYTGGVVGINTEESTVENCYNTGSVTGSDSFVGGVAGINSEGTVESCYNTGNVKCIYSDFAGGVVGISDGSVKNCYSTGSVEGVGDYVGGVAGSNNDGTAECCYYDKTSCGDIGAIGFEYDIEIVTGLTTDQMTGTDALSNMSGFSSDTWLTKANTDDIRFYPHLKGFAYDNSEAVEDWPPKYVNYPLWVGGNQVTTGNKGALEELDGISVDEGGSVKFVPDADGKGGTLYLNNATITGTQEYDYNGVSTSNILVENTEFDLTINLEGENIINGRADRGIWLPRNTYDAALKIEGEGSIDITAVTGAIMCDGSLTIDGTTVNATSTRADHSGFGIISDYINITGSAVKAEASSPNGTGLYANASLNIADSTVEATGEHTGIYVDNGLANEGLTVSGISIVTAEGGNQSSAIFSRGGYHFEDGNDIVTPENFKYGKLGMGTIVLNSDDSAAKTVVIGQPCAVTFKNFDGTELQSSKILKGTAPEYKGETPVRTDESGQYTYTFSGWKDGSGNTYGTEPEFPVAESDITYTAQFTETPVDYTVTFFVDGKQYSQLTVPFGAPVSSPRTPQKDNYDFTGWDAEIPEKMPAQNLEFNAVFKATEYTATFTADGETVDTRTYTVETETLDEPEVPAKEGYEGKWSDYTIAAGDMEITAQYTAIEYTATFIADGENVGEVKFTVEDDSIDEPEVPAKEGYEGKWSDYTIAAGDMEITAEYTAIEYTATFVNENGETVDTRTYTVETETLDEPEVPAKEGYEGKWSEYTLAASDIEIAAEYTIAEYTATFIADGETVAEIPYTVETESIDAPAVPAKEGFTGEWEEYELTPGGITVNAVYTEVIPEDVCPLDNEDHGDGFFGRVLTFLHTLIWKAFRLFGLNVFFKVS